MAQHTKIEWCDHTFNGWRGCTKVSPGCKNCYAEKLVTQRLKGEWGPGRPRQLASDAMWREPLKWNRAAAEAMLQWSEPPAVGMPPQRPRVFCSSLADWLDEEAPVEWLARLMRLIAVTPHLNWLLLTKRPGNWLERMEAVCEIDGDSLAWSWLAGNAPANIWIGTSVEDQEHADERITALPHIPARVRFISMEPLLGPVDLCCVDEDPGGYYDALHGALFFDGRNEPAEAARIDWVIVGGESGPHARPMVVEWAEDIRRQCAAAGVACFIKQLGAQPVTTNANLLDWPDETEWAPYGDYAAGGRALLTDRKGGDWAEWPEELRVRQFPEVAR